MSDPIDWWIRLAATLAVVADRAGELAGRVADDWADDHGRERADRLAALHRDLHAEAGAAQAVVESHADRSDEATQVVGIHLPALTSPGRTADDKQGVRLPGIEVERVDDEPGVQLPGS